VLLGLVDGVVLPPAALLHAVRAPLRVREELALGQHLGQVLGQDHVPAGGHTRKAPTSQARLTQAGQAHDGVGQQVQSRVGKLWVEAGGDSFLHS